MAKPTTLTTEEKAVIKALLADGMRNQDILTLINYEREATINFGRISGVKSNASIQQRKLPIQNRGICGPLQHRMDIPTARVLRARTHSSS